MRRIRCLVLLIIAFSSLLSCQANAGTQPVSDRGIAVLASSIGSDFSPENLAKFVQHGKFSLVVVDWAWITYHWDRTNFTSVNRFLSLMSASKVKVAAMYRPRFIGNPTVPTQVGQDGKRGVDHAEICYSEPTARQWGISWGEKILQKCPGFKEIIIYNPLNSCRCAKCSSAYSNGQHTAVMGFLSEAKSAWQAGHPGVKLGVVYMPVSDFWTAGMGNIDVAHPFLRIREDVDPAQDIADIRTVRSIVGAKMGSCLAKITWEEGAKVSIDKLKSVDELAAKDGIPYFFWTFDTLFASSLYDRKAVEQALGMIPSVASNAAAQTNTTSPNNAGTANGNAAADGQVTEAKRLLKEMARPDQVISCSDSLIRIGKESDAQTRGSIIPLVAAAMNDKSRDEYSRWMCCKVLSGIGDERAVPHLVKLLLNDGSEIVRSVAASELGEFYKQNKSAEVRDGLLKSARTETSSRVREELTRIMGNEAMPSSTPTSTSMQRQIPSSSQSAEQTSTPVVSGYSAEAIRNTPAEVFINRLSNAEPGYAQFDAMNALIIKAKESDDKGRAAILSIVIGVMLDQRCPIYQRFQCCYVVSGCGDERGVPYLIRILQQDESDTMRGVAVEALAKFPQNADAHNALLQASRQDTSQTVRDALARNFNQTLPATTQSSPSSSSSSVEELAPSGAPKPPAGPARPVSKPLPWPFPGGCEDQSIFNNYQQATDIYIHCGLDFIHPAGTEVKAVGSGYVAAIYTNYPQWVTHHFFIVTPVKGGNRGWCYTHIDPRTYTFKVGDYIQEGQELGSLVDFSLGNQPGVAHLHLNYVSFEKDASGKVVTHSLLDPLYFFDWKDTVPPALQPLRFVQEGTLRQFQSDTSGAVTVSGRVDVLAAVTDSAFPGHMGNLGVPVVMLSISDGTHTMQKLVLDHRGNVGDETVVQPLYLSYREKQALFDPDSFPRYQVLRVTKTDGDGKITPRDASECWDTTARDGNGNPIWPDGKYSVNVYAWDIAGNRGVVGATVFVKNGLSAR